MTEQQRPDEDVEGHRRHFFEDPEETGTTEALEDDVEGHRRRFHQDAEASGDDVEGHGRTRLDDDASDDDVEGHSHAARRPL
jgi:hypothetical protein